MTSGLSTVLIVDDSDATRAILSALVAHHGHIPRVAQSGEAALEAVSADPPDLILMDAEMPGMGGIEALRRLKTSERWRSIPVIVVTGMTDRDTRLHALESGAEDFLTKPVDSLELAMRLRNQLRLKEYSDFLRNRGEALETLVAERTNELSLSYRETIHLLTSAAEHRDEDTGNHIRRVSRYTAVIATALGCDAEFVSRMSFASPLHDIGKIAVPDRILLKPAALTPGEWEIMRTHTILGRRLLERGTTPYLKLGAEIAATHHERYDGSGYPLGLHGDEIPLSGRIMSICDQYDALRSARPYKPALDHQTACNVIIRGDGRTQPEHFCPRAFQAFRDSHMMFAQIYDESSDA